MSETEEERMAREISQEEEKHHGPAHQERREYRGYKPVEMHRQASTEQIAHQISASQPPPRGEPHLKHSYIQQAKQTVGRGLGYVGHYAQVGAQAIGGAYGKYESFQRAKMQRELEKRPYEKYKYHRKVRELDLKSREEQLNQLRLRGGGAYGLARGVYSRGRSPPSQGWTNPFASWGIGQQQQGAPKSYEYARSGAPRRYERSEESQALAARSRELKQRSRQLRRIARRERALANREAQMQMQTPQSGGGGFFDGWHL